MYYKSNQVYISIGIGIGIGNFVADISVIGISVKTHITAPLLSFGYFPAGFGPKFT